MWGDHGSANPSAQVCAARGRRPAADRCALTRARIWLSYASVPVGDGGGGVAGGLAVGLGVGVPVGLGVARGVEPRAGDVDRGGGGTEVGDGVGVGALAVVLDGVAAGVAVSVAEGSVLVGADDGDPVVAGASTTRGTVGAGSLHAVRPATRPAAPSSAAANRPRVCDMTVETTPPGPWERRSRVGCTTPRRRS
jgi:hypothetical protein